MAVPWVAEAWAGRPCRAAGAGARCGVARAAHGRAGWAQGMRCGKGEEAGGARSGPPPSTLCLAPRRSQNGHTPLHHAVNGKVECVKVLMEAGDKEAEGNVSPPPRPSPTPAHLHAPRPPPPHHSLGAARRIG